MLNFEMRIKLISLHPTMSEVKFILAETAQKKNLSDMHKHRLWDQDQFIPHNTHIHSNLPLLATKFQGSCEVIWAGSYTSWWVRILSRPWLCPCWFCFSLLNTALGLVLSVWNGNEPSYFWALLCICRQTYRPLLWFIRTQTLFRIKRARYLRWDERAFIYWRGEEVWALKLH